MQPIKVGIIVPCYNEEEVLNDTHKILKQTLSDLLNKNLITKDSFIGYIDDGSKDKTWDFIELFSCEDSNTKSIKLSANQGHQAALLCGLLYFKKHADCLISIDADLQDDVTVFEEMIQKHLQGFEVVYGARKNRSSDTFLKRNTALIYYKFLKLLGINIIPNHADFRLAGKNVLNALEEYNETNLFLRGIFPLLGFKQSVVYYDRKERKAGYTKYTLHKMFTLAFDGLTSFSSKPLRIIAILGVIILILCLFLTIWVIFTFFFIKTVPGWASTVLPIYFIGGVQMLSLGIIGEYVGKIFSEVKKRPRFIIEKEITNE